MTTTFTVAGGSVATPEGLREADIEVEDGRIVAVSPPSAAAGQTVNASGCVVLLACEEALSSGTTVTVPRTPLTSKRADEFPRG